MSPTVPEGEIVAIALAAGASAVLNALIESGTAGDVQSMIMLGAVRCAPDTLRQALSRAQWALLPLRIGDATDPGGNSTVGAALHGSSALMMAIFVVHLALLFASRFVGSNDTDENWTAEDASPSANWNRAASNVLFPSVSAASLFFFFPGIVLSAAQRYIAGANAGDDAVAVAIGVSVGGLATFAAHIWWAKAKFTATWIQYRTRNPPATAWRGWWRAFFLPAGSWAPPDYVARFGYLFWGFRPRRHWFGVFQFAKMATFAVVASLDLVDTFSCDAQFAVLGAIASVSALLVVLALPLRGVFANGLSVTSNVCVALVAFSAFMRWDAFPKVLVLFCVLSLCGGGVTCAVSLYESQYLRPFSGERDDPAIEAVAVNGRPGRRNTAFSRGHRGGQVEGYGPRDAGFVTSKTRPSPIARAYAPEELKDRPPQDARNYAVGMSGLVGAAPRGIPLATLLEHLGGSAESDNGDELPTSGAREWR